MSRADQIYRNILDAMQEADEIEGVGNYKDYQDLMQKIEHIARQRFWNCVDNERENIKPSRKQMVNKLTEYEYEWVLNRLDEKEYIYDMIKDGFKGYDNYTDDELKQAYDDKFGED
jgi:hypothetical protein